jgi:hypothetical protein
MQFSPTSCHFISLRSKYSPKHPVLKHPQCSQISVEGSYIEIIGTSWNVKEMKI